MSPRAPSKGRPRPSIATSLLGKALSELDPKALAQVIGVSVERLQRWAMPSHDMTLEQKAIIALAVIAIAPNDSALFREAASLRGQVSATVAYRSGATPTSLEAPRIRL